MYNVGHNQIKRSKVKVTCGHKGRPIRANDFPSSSIFLLDELYNICYIYYALYVWQLAPD